MRPNLDKKLSAQDFKAYYWLKKELMQFCREVGISTSGSKLELTAKIVQFLSHGKIVKSQTRSKKKTKDPIALSTIITKDFTCSRETRNFFIAVIGPQFHYSVTLQKYIHENIGKTYQDIVDQWHRQKKAKRRKTIIAPQFEYNAFIRQYFENNKGGSLRDAIAEWKQHKSKRKQKDISHAHPLY